MKIVKTSDPNVIKAIKENVVKYIDANEVKDYDLKSITKWLRVSATNPMVVIFVAMNDEGNKSVGHCIAGIMQTLNNERFDISQIIGDTEEIEKELLLSLEKYAKELNVSQISIMTKYPKKFKENGFELNSHVLYKEI